jgi:hypothetical protein
MSKSATIHVKILSSNLVSKSRRKQIAKAVKAVKRDHTYKGPAAKYIKIIPTHK